MSCGGRAVLLLKAVLTDMTLTGFFLNEGKPYHLRQYRCLCVKGQKMMRGLSPFHGESKATEVVGQSQWVAVGSRAGREGDAG